MKRGKVCRLSPNEEVGTLANLAIFLQLLLCANLITIQAAVLKQKKEKKRRARLLQVREQERGLARRMCQDVQSKRDDEKRLLDYHIQASLANAYQEELKQLEAHYSARIGQMGQGHRAAEQVMQVCTS